MTEAAHRVVIIGFEQAALLDIACVSDTLDVANQHGADPRYDVRLASLRGRPVRGSSGLALIGGTPVERLRDPIGTLVVAGGLGHLEAAGNTELVHHVRRLADLSGRVASVCTGASVLAAAGLLDGRQATTHWATASDLADEYPAVTVDPRPLFIVDGPVSTSAGMTSALDLTLAFVEADHGPELARSVARFLVTYLQRPGNQSQVSMYVKDPAPDHRVLREVVRHITAHPDGDLTTPALAARAGLSERHLSRLFLDQLGRSPARFVRAARTEAAARLLEGTALPLAAVARRCGFGSTETLRQAFQDRYDISPSVYRLTLRRRAGLPRGTAPG
ncbi:GlxA family transcriptional regulator [Streptomyces griseoruber]|uniref:AraC family transcriptional regulator n=1 Tax=Streptomyces griseoruber TaxID=1943 RepID=A0A101SLH5_9ACTN|nr:helix-turn-helix domain-containing protein [Streptomyces griseoruber]KUN75963.1 AraC family transcriptional regulator [Streptomyces griseoruber]